jgi:hypothetical protein
MDAAGESGFRRLDWGRQKFEGDGWSVNMEMKNEDKAEADRPPPPTFSLGASSIEALTS